MERKQSTNLELVNGIDANETEGKFMTALSDGHCQSLIDFRPSPLSPIMFRALTGDGFGEWAKSTRELSRGSDPAQRYEVFSGYASWNNSRH